MRKLGMISAIALLVSAGNAFALTASLSVGGNGGIVPLAAGSVTTFDVQIDFLREGATNNFGGAQTYFVAVFPAGGITINPSVGGTTSTGTGTRYNGPAEWDSSTSAGAQNPNTTLAGPMTSGVTRGLLGTLYAANGGIWSTGNSTFGWLNVTVTCPSLATTTLIVLSPDSAQAADNDTFEDVPMTPDGVTFQCAAIPEPASALLLLAAVPFMRRRRTA